MFPADHQRPQMKQVSPCVQVYNFLSSSTLVHLFCTEKKKNILDLPGNWEQLLLGKKRRRTGSAVDSHGDKCRLRSTHWRIRHSGTGIIHLRLCNIGRSWKCSKGNPIIIYFYLFLFALFVFFRVAEALLGSSRELKKPSNRNKNVFPKTKVQTVYSFLLLSSPIITIEFFKLVFFSWHSSVILLKSFTVPEVDKPVVGIKD